jgi:hypothetical protein
MFAVPKATRWQPRPRHNLLIAACNATLAAAWAIRWAYQAPHWALDSLFITALLVVALVHLLMAAVGRAVRAERESLDKRFTEQSDRITQLESQLARLTGAEPLPPSS